VATRPDPIRVHAPAKINLFLHVTGKRPDGFHDLQSLVAFAEAGDVLALERGPNLALTVEGPFAAGLENDADNLVLRAARALAPRLTGTAHFRLTKNLPVASGIGGGSADAAAALRGLLALEGRDFASEADLGALAAALGSDIPVCLASRAAWMEGRGERVTELPALPSAHLVLVNPGISVSTAEVFRRLVRRDETRLSPPAAFASLDALVLYLKETRNDLEAPARVIAPVIDTVLNALANEGAAFARMSGSGATCFGLFETAESASAAANAIAKAELSWWVRAAGFAPPEFAYPR
jgi:4-diphosphocytidyl-2-C-methyl-D-erythritol kinase